MSLSVKKYQRFVLSKNFHVWKFTLMFRSKSAWIAASEFDSPPFSNFFFETDSIDSDTILFRMQNSIKWYFWKKFLWRNSREIWRSNTHGPSPRGHATIKTPPLKQAQLNRNQHWKQSALNACKRANLQEKTQIDLHKKEIEFFFRIVTTFCYSHFQGRLVILVRTIAEAAGIPKLTVAHASRSKPLDENHNSAVSVFTFFLYFFFRTVWQDGRHHFVVYRVTKSLKVSPYRLTRFLTRPIQCEWP